MGIIFLTNKFFENEQNFLWKRVSFRRKKTNNKWTKCIVQRNEKIIVFINNDKDRQKRTIENCSNELDKNDFLTILLNERFTKERFYLMNGFTERTFLLNDRYVRKRMKWMENERKFLKTTELNLFSTIEKKTNETGRSQTMNERNEKRPTCLPGNMWAESSLYLDHCQYTESMFGLIVTFSRPNQFCLRYGFDSLDLSVWPRLSWTRRNLVRILILYLSSLEPVCFLPLSGLSLNLSNQNSQKLAKLNFFENILLKLLDRESLLVST